VSFCLRDNQYVIVINPRVMTCPDLLQFGIVFYKEMEHFFTTVNFAIYDNMKSLLKEYFKLETQAPSVINE